MRNLWGGGGGGGGQPIRYCTDLSDPRPGGRSRGKSTRDVVRLSRRSAGAGNMPEGPLKSRTVMMRDECSCRSLAASGRLIQCSNSVLQFPVQNSETSHTSQKLSAKREELSRGHLPPTITRHSGFEGRLGEKCRYAKRRGTLLGKWGGTYWDTWSDRGLFELRLGWGDIVPSSRHNRTP